MQNSNIKAGTEAQQSTEAEVPTSGSHNAKPHVISSVASTIADGSIVWIKDNLQVHCGQVRKVYADDKQALVMNFDKWSDWLVDFDKIIRVGVSYYTDDYRHYSSQQHCL